MTLELTWLFPELEGTLMLMEEEDNNFRYFWTKILTYLYNYILRLFGV